MPLFGIKETGIGIIDCPGSNENDYLTLKAIQYSQKADIIIFCFKTSTPISNNDRDVKHVKLQEELGKHIIYVYNIEAQDKPEDISEKLIEFNNVFGIVKLHVIDLMNDLQKTNFNSLKKQICNYYHSKSKYKIAQFLYSFEKLIRSQHLFICRIISMHVDQSSVSLPNYSKKVDKEDFVKKTLEIKNSISSLVKAAEKRFEEDKRQFIEWFKTEVRSCSQYIQDNNILDSSEIDTQFVQQPVNFMQLFKDSPSPFEEAVKRRIQRAFDERMQYRITDFAAVKKKEFSKWLLEEAHKIEKESHRYLFN